MAVYKEILPPVLESAAEGNLDTATRVDVDPPAPAE